MFVDSSSASISYAERTIVPFPPGTIHLPSWADSEWLKKLTAEQIVTVKGKRGFAKLERPKMSERNEALDCRVDACAAAWIAGDESS